MRSLVIGYGLAVAAGYAIASGGGSLFTAVAVAWLGGGALSLLLCAATYVVRTRRLETGAPRVRAASDDYGKWDADLLAESFEPAPAEPRQEDGDNDRTSAAG